ncbi:MAG: glycosyltransferase family 2 protein [Bacteroidales bacterium]
MEEKPLISILIPNFNRGGLMDETLRSVADQTYDNWEAIIVDDGSQDESEDVALAFAAADNRFSFHKRERLPSGAPTCRNIALELSHGDFVIFLDSDDLLAPHCLAQRIETANKFPEYDFLVFPMLMFKGQKENANTFWNKSNGRDELLRFLELDAVWQTSGPLWRKKSVQLIGGFSEGLACWQDVDIHLKALIQKLKYIVFDDLKPDIYYRIHETGSISQGEINSPIKMKSRKDIFIKHAQTLCKLSSASEVRNSLAILGSNVTFGAIKVLNYKIANECLKFGYHMGIFNNAFIFEARLLQIMFALRMNRMGVLNQMMQKKLSRHRVVSSIGITQYVT